MGHLYTCYLKLLEGMGRWFAKTGFWGCQTKLGPCWCEGSRKVSRDAIYLTGDMSDFRQLQDSKCQWVFIFTYVYIQYIYICTFLIHVSTIVKPMSLFIDGSIGTVRRTASLTISHPPRCENVHVWGFRYRLGWESQEWNGCPNQHCQHLLCIHMIIPVSSKKHK